MNRNNIKYNKGFIALMSAVIISAIMMGILFTVNRSTFYARFDTLDGEYKQIASNLAESCIHAALLELAKNYSYDPVDVPITINDGTCYIVSTLPHGPRGGSSSTITITTKGRYRGTFSSYQALVKVMNPSTIPSSPTPPNITINSWTEIN